MSQRLTLGQDGGGTLVLYVRLTSDEPEHEANFRYFLRRGLAESDGAMYIILVDSSLVCIPIPYKLKCESSC